MFKQVDAFRENYKDIMYAIFRVVFGLIFMLHGLQKFGVLGGSFALPGKTLMLVAGTVEVIGGLLIMLGLFTVIAAFLAAGQMAVAFFMAHVGGALSKGASGFAVINPLANGGEAAALFCFAWLLVVFLGPGKHSLDAKLCPVKRK